VERKTVFTTWELFQVGTLFSTFLYILIIPTQVNGLPTYEASRKRQIFSKTQAVSCELLSEELTITRKVTDK
jgi:hypothetical protein